MRTHFILLYATILVFQVSCQVEGRRHVEEQSLDSRLEEVLLMASDQYQHMMDILPADRFPKTYHLYKDELETSGSDWWCSGFYPGSLLLLYEHTREEVLLEEARRVLKLLEKEKHNTSTHDLGFMMYCSFGNALDIAPESGYKEILIRSAQSLITRFDETTGVIKSWDSAEGDYLVIIDNMMNLELLFWAARETGDSVYYDIAIKHADKTMKEHFRDDFSSFHVINYDPRTGEVKEKKTAQGFSAESAWARGQAWGLYGYTVMYRFTQDPIYLRQATGIADFILNHPNLPSDKVPYWDFDAPNIPDALRDSSAGAIIASALLELALYADDERAVKYQDDAEVILESLSSAPYLTKKGSNGGFVLKHGVGHIPENTEVDTPLSYGDYYFIEAIKRYLMLKKG